MNGGANERKDNQPAGHRRAACPGRAQAGGEADDVVAMGANDRVSCGRGNIARLGDRACCGSTTAAGMLRGCPQHPSSRVDLDRQVLWQDVAARPQRFALQQRNSMVPHHN